MIKVSTLMPTRNHGQFIEQAIESFLEQKCDFDIELIVSDNCSTDNTEEIARAYATKFPGMIKYHRQEKDLGLIGNYHFLIGQIQGQYIAILESDDYWTDPLKLQKQVTIMDSDPAIGMVYTSWRNVDINGKVKTLPNIDPSMQGDNMYEREIICNVCAAVTVCFSADKFFKYCSIDDYLQYEFKAFDYPTWLALSAHSKVSFLPDFTADYRVSDNSVSNNIDWAKMSAFADNMKVIVDYTIGKYGQGGLTDVQVQNAHTVGLMTLTLRCGQKKEFYKLAKTIRVDGLKSFVRRYFPLVLIWKNNFKKWEY